MLLIALNAKCAIPRTSLQAHLDWIDLLTIIITFKEQVYSDSLARRNGRKLNTGSTIAMLKIRGIR
jgi:hypothetical protein